MTLASAKSVVETKTENLLQTVRERLDRGERELHWVGLKGGALAYLLSKLIVEQRLPCVVLTSSSQRASELFDEAHFFLQGIEEIKPLFFPSRRSKPFYLSPPSLPRFEQRAETLLALSLQQKIPILFTSIHGLIEKTLPRKEFQSLIQPVSLGDSIDREILSEALHQRGYTRTSLVQGKGEFSVKGGIVDYFPIGASLPIRIEFGEERIESLRSFDPKTQRSLTSVEEVTLAPRTEFVWGSAQQDRLKHKLKERADEIGFPKPTRDSLMSEMENPNFSPQIPPLLPFFQDSLANLLDYLSPTTQWILEDPIDLDREWERLKNEMAENYRLASESLLLPAPEKIFSSFEEIKRDLQSYPKIFVDKIDLYQVESHFGETLYFQCRDHKGLRKEMSEHRDQGLAPLVQQLREWSSEGIQTFIVGHTEERLNQLAPLLQGHGLPTHLRTHSPHPSPSPLWEEGKGKGITLIPGNLKEGFVLIDERISILTEEEIFGSRPHPPSTRSGRQAFLNTFSQLKMGDLVVHLEHGIGAYQGLQHLVVDGIPNDFLLIGYANNDRLYLPVDRLRLLQKHIGAGGKKLKLDRLGGEQWERTQAKVARSVQEVAKDLVELYATRCQVRGHAYSPRDPLFQEFEASFPYEETPDQQTAIEDVLTDMGSEKPMDRLLCGEVGYGKTEVATRAAFRAASDGKQVAFLVPTTILAQQHYRTFIERLQGLPVRVEVLNRFVPNRKQKEILQDLKLGRIDILIGTQRILQKDVIFRDLGALILDEEHRFGVRDKEKIKQLKKSIDVLAMTATPIPRTLQLSLIGARDLSVINTPPIGRQPIETFLVPDNDKMIQEGILKELERKGQIFFVHNRIETLTETANRLKQLIPQLRIGVAHGQMSSQQLEKVIIDFIDQRTDCLVCTSIIGSGIDIPSANTLFIDRADRFGLSDLHQLRGRVGRSSEKAYAYLLVPTSLILTPEAQKRLQAIQEHSDLGSSFKLAMEDLDIRGAGHLLGETQSGHIAVLGYELYQQMLEKALSELKGETLEHEEMEPEIQLKVPAYIPEAFIPEVSERLSLYKRLSGLLTSEEIALCQEELEDRYGPLPPPFQNLMRVLTIKTILRPLRIQKIEFHRNQISYLFDPKTPLHSEVLLRQLHQNKTQFRFVSSHQLVTSARNQIGIAILGEVENQLEKWLSLLEKEESLEKRT
ncbi:MAG: transcription-repair coupling factor [Deltaproteobacteria bacterium]|nr:transcription-repair coupling factor [Deltaproteobacteria bacterium]